MKINNLHKSKKNFLKICQPLTDTWKDLFKVWIEPVSIDMVEFEKGSAAFKCKPLRERGREWKRECACKDSIHTPIYAI